MNYMLHISPEQKIIKNYNKKLDIFKFIFDEDRSFQINWNKKHKLKTSIYRSDIAEVKTNSKNYKKFLESGRKLKENGGYIHIHMIEEIYENDNANWYEFIPMQNDLSILYERYFEKETYNKNYEINASLFPIYGDVFYDENGYLVSENFRKICLKNDLKGIDFIWAKDVGKYKTRQFFKPVIKNSMGIGIQHPLFKGKTNNKFPEQLIFIDIYDDIVLNYWNDFAKDIESVTLKQFGKIKLTVNKRFFKNKIPNVDFAYYNRNGDTEFYMSKKAFEILSKNGIIWYESIPIIETDICPKSSENLIGDKGFYIMNVDEKIKNSMIAYNEFLKVTKPEKIVKSREIINYLRQNKKIYKKDFHAGISKIQKEKLKNIYPNEIIEIYSISNGCYINRNYEIRFLPYEYIEDYTNDMKKNVLSDEIMLNSLNEFLNKENMNILDGIEICHGAGGDSYVLLKNKKVLKIDYESYQNYTIWNNIYEFINDIINHNI